MSAQSGSSLSSKSLRFVIEDASQSGVPRRHASHLSQELGLNEIDAGRVGIVINELCTNLLTHARGGEIFLRALMGPQPGIEILAVDRGPGINDIPRALQDGYSTSSTPGNGLGAIRRQSDIFDIYSSPSRGTVVLSTVFAGRKIPALKWKFGCINLAYKGETESGDAWAFREDQDVAVLVSDGLGHGLPAHQASVQALEVFKSSYGLGLENLMQRMHGALRSTRGAAISVAEITPENNLKFLGVGNVRGAVFEDGKLKNLVSYSGTVGLQLRTNKIFTQKINPNSVLILHSDGLNTRWDLNDYPGLATRHPSVIAAVLCRDFNRNTDDVTVVVGAQA